MATKKTSTEPKAPRVTKPLTTAQVAAKIAKLLAPYSTTTAQKIVDFALLDRDSAALAPRAAHEGIDAGELVPHRQCQ